MISYATKLNCDKTSEYCVQHAGLMKARNFFTSLLTVNWKRKYASALVSNQNMNVACLSVCFLRTFCYIKWTRKCTSHCLLTSLHRHQPIRHKKSSWANLIGGEEVSSFIYSSHIWIFFVESFAFKIGNLLLTSFGYLELLSQYHAFERQKSFINHSYSVKTSLIHEMRNIHNHN